MSEKDDKLVVPVEYYVEDSPTWTDANGGVHPPAATFSLNYWQPADDDD